MSTLFTHTHTHTHTHIWFPHYWNLPKTRNAIIVNLRTYSSSLEVWANIEGRGAQVFRPPTSFWSTCQTPWSDLCWSRPTRARQGTPPWRVIRVTNCRQFSSVHFVSSIPDYSHTPQHWICRVFHKFFMSDRREEMFKALFADMNYQTLSFSSSSPATHPHSSMQNPHGLHHFSKHPRTKARNNRFQRTLVPYIYGLVHGQH